MLFFVSEAPQPFDLDRTTIIFYVNVVLFYFIPMAVSLTLYALILKCVAHRKRNFIKNIQKRGTKTKDEGKESGGDGFGGGEGGIGGLLTSSDDSPRKPRPGGMESPPGEEASSTSSRLNNIIEFRKVCTVLRFI